uniref:Uncharacterized protein n=1 Tax=Chromera velia CCMP2878 TaxID=1169474 RepID=A0A0G4G9T0_9ALVE|eukprot:Cvel_578.t1-p1 / transcript=Cvel_578.t1 / gene=Cvel_578 / organism=Chromera_velia_CCMP2878 / gene_product=hypothetical protein / transcript_product=hypothetical protein / location=Cvel_scaffold18:22973-23722(+) / protein_length=250 / sequence_SO=supercontig / SO=protein_coding / is_pseudo=false
MRRGTSYLQGGSQSSPSIPSIHPWLENIDTPPPSSVGTLFTEEGEIVIESPAVTHRSASEQQTDSEESVQAGQGPNMVIDVDKLKALAEVKRVVEVFDPKKKNGRTWFSQFRDKVKAGNLNVDEYKLLLSIHFVDTDLVQQWDEKRGTCSTVDEVDAWFLDAYGGGGMEEKHAVYMMADVKLSVADAFQPFVDRFIDTFMAANPNAIRNHRIMPFINAFYPEMREALEIEPAFSEWNDLIKRTEHLHAKL